MVRKTVLPDRPSAGIMQAIKDLKRAERTKNLRVDMGVWMLQEDDSLCAVCIAGAVMRFGQGRRLSSTGDACSPSDTSGDKISGRLEAINEFRLSYVRRGVSTYLNIPSNELLKIRNKMRVARYETNKRKFYRDMNRIAKYLEGKGL